MNHFSKYPTCLKNLFCFKKICINYFVNLNFLENSRLKYKFNVFKENVPNILSYSNCAWMCGVISRCNFICKFGEKKRDWLIYFESVRLWSPYECWKTLSVFEGLFETFFYYELILWLHLVKNNWMGPGERIIKIF